MQRLLSGQLSMRKRRRELVARIFCFAGHGARLWIEAAFLRKEKGRPLTNVDKHPVFGVLKEKGRKAKRSEVSDPYVVFLGTDRVFDINSSRHIDGIGVEQAVSKAFRLHRSLSAVVLVSIFARPEIFTRIQKRPQPWLYGNPEARVPLADESIKTINLFDLERWPFDRFMRPDSRRPELRELLSSASSEFGVEFAFFTPVRDAPRSFRTRDGHMCGVLIGFASRESALSTGCSKTRNS